MHAPMFSLEVFPPRHNAPVGAIYDTLDGLQGVDPDFISVTYGHGSHNDHTATARIARTIHQEYHIPVVAHLTALYSDAAMIDNALDMFEQAGVSAVLALRGDYIDGEQPVGQFEHASDLVAYIREHKPDLTVFAACYPEGHIQAASLDEDIEHLKVKVEAGATHLITQLFYDNDDFYRFVDKARSAGVDVPIEAGIMPIGGPKSVRSSAARNGSRVPERVETMLNRWGDDAATLREAGVNYASEQITDLVAHGVDGIHLYTMNHPGRTRAIWRNIQPLFTKVPSIAPVSSVSSAA